MKKLVCTLLIATLVLASCSVAYSENIMSSIEHMSEEELVGLRARIDGKLLTKNKGDLIFNRDGYQIKWMGFNDDYWDFWLSMLVTNPLNQPVWFRIQQATFNGIQLTMGNTGDKEVGAGATFVTSTKSNWLFSKDDLAILDMKVKDITEVSIKVEFKDGAGSKGNVLIQDTISFAIDGNNRVITETSATLPASEETDSLPVTEDIKSSQSNEEIVANTNVDSKANVDADEVCGCAATILNDIKHDLLDRESMEVRNAFAWINDDEWLFDFIYVAKNRMGGLSENEVLVCYNVEKDKYTEYNLTQQKGDYDIIYKFDELMKIMNEEIANGRLIMLSLDKIREDMDLNQRLRQAFGMW